MPEVIRAGADGSVWIRAKVPTGKASLDYFMEKWGQTGKVPFNGEFEAPQDRSLERSMTTEVENISHCITDVDSEKWDPKTCTVPIKCRFTGPHGSEAQEMFLDGDIRVLARTAVDPKSGDFRIVTFDLAQRPDRELVSKLTRRQENKKEAEAKFKYDHRKK